MSNELMQAAIHGLAVTVGLFALWSVVGGMRRLAASSRLGYALLAGAVSGGVTLAVGLAV